MAIFVAVIPMVFFSLAMAKQELATSLDGWWYLVRPVQISPLPSSTSGLLSSELPVGRDDYTYTTGIGSHKVHTLAATWNDARKICEEEGGHLAIINSNAEEHIIIALFQKAGKFTTQHGELAFIGIHDMFKEGEFVTIHGQSFAKVGFTQWRAGEPNNAGAAEDCGTISRNGGLNDSSCNLKLVFVCELPVDGLRGSTDAIIDH